MQISMGPKRGPPWRCRGHRAPAVIVSLRMRKEVHLGALRFLETSGLEAHSLEPIRLALLLRVSCRRLPEKVQRCLQRHPLLHSQVSVRDSPPFVSSDQDVHCGAGLVPQFNGWQRIVNFSWHHRRGQPLLTKRFQVEFTGSVPDMVQHPVRGVVAQALLWHSAQKRLHESNTATTHRVRQRTKRWARLERCDILLHTLGLEGNNASEQLPSENTQRPPVD
mmetsp:Transcript_29365/g.77619  ORF Transcript_29365/g.77619 Transcript_29365/m.77619 type:complete len:221 (+) Transcript_29365:383-1045(+)